ncbi:MAG: NifU family protein [Bdellovibrionaceae bacterium]|nr:NifU family protein [Pseudobdellovibrionaceae bacterium]
MSKVTFEATPNPATMKFYLHRTVTTESFDFSNVSEADISPLASKIFGFPWTAGVFLGPDFLTVTKQDWVDWDVLAEPLAQLIENHISSGLPVVDKRDSSNSNVSDISESDPEVVKRIKRVLNSEIRPVVAMDGGDVEFSHFEDGVVYLRMRGSCNGCPSSQATLKEGIEVRLKQAVPEIREVLSI